MYAASTTNNTWTIPKFQIAYRSGAAILFVAALCLSSNLRGRGLRRSLDLDSQVESSGGFVETTSDAEVLLAPDDVDDDDVGGDIYDTSDYGSDADAIAAKNEAIQCYNDLFRDQKEKILGDYRNDRPVVNSVGRDKDGNVTIYMSLPRNTNLKSNPFRNYMWSDWYCDSNQVPAHVYRHNHKTSINNIKMACPPGTSQSLFLDPAVGEVSYELAPFLECHDKLDALLPPARDQHGQNAHTLACTQVKFAENVDLLPQWIEYNRMVLGIEQVFVYLNDKYELLEQESPAVADYLALPDVRDHVGIIPYEWVDLEETEKNMFQHAVYHDCLNEASKRNVSWVMLNDVDEYMTLLNPNVTLKEFLKPYEHNDTVAAVSARNVYFGVESEEQQQQLDRTKPRLLIRDFVYRTGKATAADHRSKMFVKPNHATYVMVHKIGVGNATIQTDPFTELRSSHFRRVGTCRRDVKDTFLHDHYAQELEDRIAEVYHPADPAQYYPDGIGKC